MNQLIQKRWPLALIGVGGFLILAGLAVMLLLSSIPGPDDAPAVVDRERAWGSAGFAVLVFGASLAITGVIGGIVRAGIARLSHGR